VEKEAKGAREAREGLEARALRVALEAPGQIAHVRPELVVREVLAVAAVKAAKAEPVA
jgi:hypothetical protein